MNRPYQRRSNLNNRKCCGPLCLKIIIQWVPDRGFPIPYRSNRISILHCRSSSKISILINRSNSNRHFHFRLSECLFRLMTYRQ